MGTPALQNGHGLTDVSGVELEEVGFVGGEEVVEDGAGGVDVFDERVVEEGLHGELAISRDCRFDDELLVVDVAHEEAVDARGEGAGADGGDAAGVDEAHCLDDDVGGQVGDLAAVGPVDGGGDGGAAFERDDDGGDGFAAGLEAGEVLALGHFEPALAFSLAGGVAIFDGDHLVEEAELLSVSGLGGEKVGEELGEVATFPDGEAAEDVEEDGATVSLGRPCSFQWRRMRSRPSRPRTLISSIQEQWLMPEAV